MRRLLILLLLGGCSPSETRITATGSSTIAPLVNEIAKRFEKAHPGVRVDVQTGGSSRGIGDARSGMADVGLVSRALKSDESDLLAFPIARDGVCVIVHRDNPVPALSDAQVVAIYTGRTTTWRDVGGRDAPITVVNKAEGRSTLEIFLAHHRLRASDVKAQVVIGDNEHGIKTVAADPNAVGYVSIGSAGSAASRGVPIRLMPCGGVPATLENVRDGRFPLSRPLNLVVRSAPGGAVKAFIDACRSAEMHDLVRSLHFVPLPPP